MDKLFFIGGFRFRLEYPEGLPIPENFLLFGTEHGTPEYTYRLRTADSLPQPAGEVIARRPDLTVFRSPAGESRLIGVKGQPGYYACLRELPDRQAEITLTADTAQLRFDPVFVSLFALERRMLERDSLILHCAYTVYRDEAILFSAPSETGKSTQAGLWERYRGSRTVNGDRALLRRIGGRWNACGWPVCGSSGICGAEDTPVRAIVMLRQGAVNQAVRLSPIQAFTQLYAQITVNQWNPDFVSRVMSDLDDLLGRIPVYQLTCDMTEDAVRCLEDALFPG